MLPQFVGSCAFVTLGLAVKYPRGLKVVLLHHNFGVSIDGVHIGRALGWDIEFCVVLWSHSLTLRPGRPYCINPIIS